MEDDSIGTPAYTDDPDPTILSSYNAIGTTLTSGNGATTISSSGMGVGGTSGVSGISGTWGESPSTIGTFLPYPTSTATWTTTPYHPPSSEDIIDLGPTLWESRVNDVDTIKSDTQLYAEGLVLTSLEPAVSKVDLQEEMFLTKIKEAVVRMMLKNKQEHAGDFDYFNDESDVKIRVEEYIELLTELGATHHEGEIIIPFFEM